MRERLRQVFGALVLALSCCPSAGAQSPAPYVSGRLTRMPDAGFETGTPQAQVATSENQLSIGLWRGARDDWSFGVALDYQYTRYTYDGVASRNRDLHRLQAPVDFEGRARDWAFEGYAAIGIATSSNVIKDPLKRLGSEDFFVAGRVEARRARSADSDWLVGLRYDRALGSPRLYPVVGVERRVSDALTFRLAAPDPALRYVRNDRQEILLRVYPAGSEWHVVTDDFAEDFDYTFEAWRAEASFSVRVWRDVRLDLIAGYEADREHGFRDDALAPIDAGAESSWLLGAGLRWGAAPLPATHGAQL